jgi:hypothetical protein
MQLRIPLVPLAIRFERRPLEPFRPRVTVRGLMAIIAFLAVMVWLFMTYVALPAARQRYQQADGLFRLHVAVLLRAYEEERTQERVSRELARKDSESCEKENREAERWPEAAQEQEHHQHLASLWDRAGRDQIRVANLAARRASLFKRRLDELLELRRQAGHSIVKLEDAAKEAEKWPETSEWEQFHLGNELAVHLNRMLNQQRNDPRITGLQLGKNQLRKTVRPGL